MNRSASDHCILPTLPQWRCQGLHNGAVLKHLSLSYHSLSLSLSFPPNPPHRSMLSIHFTDLRSLWATVGLTCQESSMSPKSAHAALLVTKFCNLQGFSIAGPSIWLHGLHLHRKVLTNRMGCSSAAAHEPEVTKAGGIKPSQQRNCVVLTDGEQANTFGMGWSGICFQN